MTRVGRIWTRRHDGHGSTGCAYLDAACRTPTGGADRYRIEDIERDPRLAATVMFLVDHWRDLRDQSPRKGPFADDY